MLDDENNICLLQWVIQREEKDAESLFEEVMANKVTNLVNIINLPVYKL